MSQLELTNVIVISVSTAEAGVNNYNTSNLGLFTHEVPNMSFGSLGYAFYLSPTQVGVDFGTSSTTYKMANAIFSQQPNILTGGGQLIVILMDGAVSPIVAVQHVAFSSVPTVGNYQLGYNGNYTANIAYSANAATVQIALRLVSGLGSVTVLGDTTAGFNVTFTGITGPALLMTVRNNSLQDTSGYDVVVTPATTVVGVPTASAETLGAAVTRTSGLVQYFGVMETAHVTTQTQANVLAAAAIVQALNKIAFFVSYDEDDVQSGGILDLLTTGGFTQSRGLFYDDSSDSGLPAILFMAAYGGRALSTNFSGSNTTSTMHLKTLVGIEPDPSITQTFLNLAVAAGADTYPSLQGVPKVFTSGANSFFDQIYNRLWLAGALQVAGFNYLAQSSTKVPQTENGMDGLKGAYRKICEQAVTNQYSAPGAWNSSTVFGNPSDLILNVAQRGYYIYSTPVNLQSQADREDRIAPLVQIALKEAGAIQKSTVIVTINA